MADDADSDEPGDASQGVHLFVPADPPPHPDEERLWRGRAQDYGSKYNHQYKGNVHWQRALNTLAATGSLPLALKEAGLARATFNKRRERYPEFADAVDSALQWFREQVIERTAVARAVDGTLKQVFFKGVVVGYERVYSDTLLAKLMDGHLPERYGKQRVEMNTPPGQPFQTEDVTDDPLTRVRARLADALARDRAARVPSEPGSEGSGSA